MRSLPFLILCLLTRLSTSALADSRYRLGAILPLTGDSALGGQACRNGLELALRDLDGRGANPLSLVVEDNAGSSTSTVSAYQKLQTTGGVDAVVVWESGAALTLAPLTERRGVVLVATSGNREAAAGRNHVFLYWLSLETEVRAVVEEARRRGYKRLARIVTQQPGLSFMRSELDRVGVPHLSFPFDEEVSTELRDFRPLLLKLKQRGDIDGIIAFVWYGQMGLFAKQARELGISAPLIGSDILEDENEVKFANGALEGAWFPQIADPQPDFEAKYKQAFPGASIYSAGNCYDIAALIAAARREKQDVTTFLNAVQHFPGALGRVSASGDHGFDFPVVIREVRNNAFVTVRAIEREGSSR